MDAPLLLKVDEAARRLNLSRTKAYELVAEGKLPSVRLGDQIRVPADALDRWINELSKGSGH